MGGKATEHPHLDCMRKFISVLFFHGGGKGEVCAVAVANFLLHKFMFMMRQSLPDLQLLC